jgi:cell division protease FtsH
MVTRLGMSTLGLVALEEENRDDFGKRSEYSEDIAARIDRETRAG